ncbi:hypothetical protein ACHAW6_002493 [Cyclotella cf. meneghiniana]
MEKSSSEGGGTQPLACGKCPSSQTVARTSNSHANSVFQPIYECNNVKHLINFYYATMGYPVISTWCKAIDKGYFQGWNGQTSDRVQKFVKPSQASAQGHMDQQQAYICSTKSSPVRLPPPELDHMINHKQTPHNDKTNMFFMTMLKIKGQLFTNQTGCFSVSSNRGNNLLSYSMLPVPITRNHYPIKSRHRTKLLKAYEEVYQFL